TVKTIVNDLEKTLTKNKTLKINDVRAEVNSLNDQLEKINAALDSLKSNEAYETIQNELTEIQSKLEKLRDEQIAIKFEINRIETMPKAESISTRDIEIIYNQFKNGLGDLVSKSLDEVES